MPTEYDSTAATLLQAGQASNQNSTEAMLIFELISSSPVQNLFCFFTSQNK
jgi:hypothetical protein